MPYVTQGITKKFDSVTVLRDIDFTLKEGSVHGLIGENGAGKSTLLKIMAGLHTADKGTLTLDGTTVSHLSVHAATERGVYLVPQEPSLLPYLTIAENIAMGRLVRKRGPLPHLAWKQMEEEARASLEQLGFSVDVTLLAGSLSIAAQQLVECARAMAFNSKYIFFDEPTAPLSSAEVDVLAGRIQDLRDSGHGIVLISHRLSEVMELCDEISVFRDGQLVRDNLTPPYSEPELVHAMIGRNLAPVERGRLTHNVDGDKNNGTGEMLLEVKNLSAMPTLREASFVVRSGEVVGFAGLVGSGRTEAAECVVGLRSKGSGADVLFKGKQMAKSTTADIYRDGITYVSEDRAKHGAFLELAVSCNVTAGILDSLERPSKWGALSRRRERAATIQGLERGGVRGPSTSAPLRSLSGGNQQKCLIGRALLTEPKVCIVDEPTRGVDVGAKMRIHQLIRTLADDGMGVIMISSELEEVLSLSDRVIVFYQGEVVASVERDASGNFPGNKIGQLLVTGKEVSDETSVMPAQAKNAVGMK